MPVAAFLSEIAVVANLHAECRALQFGVEQVKGGRVVLRALCDDGRVRIEIEDECGGIPDSRGCPAVVPRGRTIIPSVEGFAERIVTCGETKP